LKGLLKGGGQSSDWIIVRVEGPKTTMLSEKLFIERGKRLGGEIGSDARESDKEGLFQCQVSQREN